MAKSTPYRVCPYCGCNLDPNERCDCQDKKPKDAEAETAQSAGQLATGKEARNQREPVLAPERERTLRDVPGVRARMERQQAGRDPMERLPLPVVQSKTKEGGAEP